MSERRDSQAFCTRPPVWRGLVAAAAVFASTCAYRFVGVDLTNDDLLFYAVGRQILTFHEWPVRDLFEEGDPLHNVISAALQAVTGHSLVGEAVFSILMLAIAAALTTLAAAHFLRSSLAGALVGALTVLASPRLYDYPKALVPAGVLVLCARYQRRPGPLNAAALGILAGVAFLLRHDLGGYAALTAVVAIWAASRSERVGLTPHVAILGAAAAAVSLPYLLFVQAHVGVVEYFAAARRFTQREVSRSEDARPSFAIDWSKPFWDTHTAIAVKVRWAAAVDAAQRAAAERRYRLTRGEVDEGLTWAYILEDSTPANLIALIRDPLIADTANIDRTIARGNAAPAPPSRLGRFLESRVAFAPGIVTRANAVAWLYYVYLMLPWLALAAAAWVVTSRRLFDVSVAELLPPVALCCVGAPLLLRGNLYENSRLADFTTPAALLGAALAGFLWWSPGAFPLARRTIVVGLAAITVVAVSLVGNVLQRVTTVAVLIDDGRFNEEMTRLWGSLVATPPGLDSVPRENGVRGAVEYLRQCTNSRDRVLVFGFFPDALYYSGRGTAADRIVILRGFGTHPDDELGPLEALRRHAAAVAIVEANQGSGSTAGRILDGLHPRLEHHLVERYARVSTTHFGGSTGALFDVWVNKDRTVAGPGPYGLPCLRTSPEI